MDVQLRHGDVAARPGGALALGILEGTTTLTGAAAAVDRATRGGIRAPDMGMMMQEIGAESPQMMAVETARQGVRAQIFDHFREVGRVVFLEVLAPAQVCDWVVAPGVAP